MKKNEDKPVVIKLDRKKIKQSAKGRVKRNYIACIAVCFIMVFIAGEYGSTTQNVSSYDNSHVADLKYDAEDKEKIIEDMVKNELTAEQVSDKWQIDNPDAVKKWLDAYKKYGVDGLNSKEVTFFGSSNDTSNLEALADAFSFSRNAKEKAQTYLNDRLNNFTASASVYFDSATSSNSYQFSLLTAIMNVLGKKSTWDTIVSFVYFIFQLMFTIFIVNVLWVCERRFFLENHTYKKTKIGRLGFLFRERTLHPARTMFVTSIYQTLWAFTIVGYPIKHYAYSMVPFICAENPNIKTRKAIKLSIAMTRGYKWQLFKVDLSMIGWTLLSSISFGAVGVFWSNPYTTAIDAEVYLQLRREAIKNKIEGYEELNDKLLDLDLLEELMAEEAAQKGENPDIVRSIPICTIKVPENNENGGGE
ncbi:DUF975 family protein [Ruminococcus bicirculans (ex Wegman et al. 2014)]|uniref:DUF975 family protein n=1 Tax=Ruminococcus bicirculans (ex Wegman et al. 2014) TaxID=1160721 RepID=UPI003A8EE1F9